MKIRTQANIEENERLAKARELIAIRCYFKREVICSLLACYIGAGFLAYAVFYLLGFIYT